MPSRSIFNEKEVLLRIANGDEAAFALLVKEFWNNIYYQALAYLKSSHDAQNVVQEVFLKIWEKRAELPGIEKIESFLFIVARNKIISELRKKPDNPAIEEFSGLTSDESLNADQRIHNKQAEEMMRKAIKSLPPQQQKVFLLSRQDNLTYDEIAGRLGISRETVKKHIVKTLGFLRTLAIHNKRSPQ